MKITKFLLFAFVLTSFSALSQNQVIVSGVVYCPDGTQYNEDGINYIFFSLDSTSTDTVGIPLDDNGNFTYIFYPNSTQGYFELSYGDGNGGQGNYIGTWSAFLMEDYVVIDACAPVEEPTCEVDIALIVDSIINPEEEYMVYMTANASGSNLTYQWSFGDGTGSTEESPLHYYSSYGTYTVCLTVYGDDECEATDCVELTASDNGTVFDGPGMMIPGFTLVVNGEVSAVEETLQNDLVLYPNPIGNASEIFMQSREAVNGSLQLYNSSGQLVNDIKLNTTAGTAALPVDMSMLSPGIYKVNILQTNGTSMQFTLIK